MHNLFHRIEKFALILGTYWVSAIILCGDFGSPIWWAYWLKSMPRFWNMCLWFSLFASIAIATPYVTPRLPGVLRPAVFMGLWIWLTVLPAGFYAEWTRRDALAAFDADIKIDHSFWESLHNPPDDFLMYFHAAAIKNCVPYTWSYRTLSFIRLSPNIAPNILPTEVTKKCVMYG